MFALYKYILFYFNILLFVLQGDNAILEAKAAAAYTDIQKMQWIAVIPHKKPLIQPAAAQLKTKFI